MKFDALRIERSFFLEKFQIFHVMYCNDWRSDFFLLDQNIFTVIYVLECLGADLLSFSVCYHRFACSPVPFQTFKLSRNE